MDAVTLGEVKKVQKELSTVTENLGELDRKVVEMVDKMNTALSNLSELVLIKHTTDTIEPNATEKMAITIPGTFNKFMLKSMYVLGTSDTAIQIEILSSSKGTPFTVYKNQVRGSELYDVADLPYIDEDSTAKLHVSITNVGTQPGTFNLRITGVTLG